MSEMLEVFCRNTNKKFLVPSGMPLKEVIKFAEVKLDYDILGATVNNKIQNLNYKIYSPKTIEFIDISNTNGRRMYSLSLVFVLYKAVKELYPKYDLYVHHSMSNGFYVEIDNLEVNENVINQIKQKVSEIIDADMPFVRKIIPSNEAIELFEKIGMKEKARQLQTVNRLYSIVDYLGDTVNNFYYELVPSTSFLKVFDLVPFDKGLLLLLPDKKNPSKVSKKNPKQEKMYSVFKEHNNWIKILGTSYVNELNLVVDGRKCKQLIHVSEALHEKKYAEIADSIYKRRDKVRFVLLAGPSSSGKTTSCRRIATQLAVLGLNPVQISLDDYFVDREYTPKDENGEYDFECIEALDIDLFNENMQGLLNGEEVQIPKFDFIEGKKKFNGSTLKLKDNSILIIEGIHALNPLLTSKIDNSNKYHVFVSALTQVSIDRQNLISSSDNRLIRRIVRDYNYRGYSAIDTLSRWQSVRKGEEKHIFPYQENADSIFNSSLLYEIGVLKVYAEPLLSAVPQNTVAYAEARRLLVFLSNFKAIPEDSIPPTSIMREFLGGSSFDY